MCSDNTQASTPSLTPYSGQSDKEIEAWFRWKYPNGATDKSPGAYAAELFKSRPNRDDPTGKDEWYSRLTGAQLAILDDAKRVKGAEKDEKKRIQFRGRYDLSDEESRKYWALRDLPPVGGKMVEWDRARDMLRKRKSAAPRKNADLSTMTPADAEQHRRKQNAEAKQRSRARKKAEQAAAVQLAPATALASTQAAPSDDIAALLAILDAAEIAAENDEANRK
ncbi:hypothetical protein [Rhodobacter maris]|uniref:Uncharacterized protein n=1 Tax=Rhodobacter maris TaxID=446682 RepID=A0A285T180_9RHOB|nr:hypothetical protein [Rhodobacter maris]SOC14356.1 hypothetical protein SAMN05877831_1123 [Rhodobacter maris]